MAVKINRTIVCKLQKWQGLVFQFLQIKWTGGRLKNHARSSGNRINGVTNHLRAQCWKFFSKRPVMHVMQNNAVPNARALHFWRQSVAYLRKSNLQCFKPGKLLSCCVQWNSDKKLHIGSEYIRSYMNISSKIIFNEFTVHLYRNRLIFKQTHKETCSNLSLRATCRFTHREIEFQKA